VGENLTKRPYKNILKYARKARRREKYLRLR